MSAAARSRPAWQSVLLALWQQRANQGSMWFWYVLAIVAALVAIGVGLLPKIPPAVPAVGLFACVAFVGWIWLVGSLLLQNRPAEARLVPGHVRTLRRVMVGAGLAIMAASGLIGLALGQALFAMAGAAVALMLMAWIMRMPGLGLFVWVIPSTQSRWSKAPVMQALGAAIADVHHRHPGWVVAATAAVLLAAGAASVRALLRPGDARHQRIYRARTKRLAALGTGRVGATSWANAGHPGALLRTLAGAPYRWVLARTCVQRSGNLIGRAFVGLGPQLHWSGHLGAALVYGAIGVLTAVLLLKVVIGGGPTAVDAMWPLAIGVLCFAISIGLVARTAFHLTRREQVLLMLLPGMPRGAALNRGIAVHLLVQFLVAWALALLVCAALAPLPQFGSAVTMGVACLPLSALLWRDWSRLRPPTQTTAAGPVAIALLVIGPALLMQLFLERALWPIALAGGVLTLVLLGWRWRVVNTSPGAFPAGRNA